MRKATYAVLISILAAGSVMAQTNRQAGEMPGKHPSVVRAGGADRMQFVQSEKGKQLREELRVIDENCRKAESEVPEIRELDVRMADLMKQVQELRAKKLELVKNNPALAAKCQEAAKIRKQVTGGMRKNMPVPVMSSSASAR